jgi:hypothetical protein
VLHLETTVIRAVLAAVFLSAAVAKGARFQDFVRYLAIPFKSWARAVALVTIAAEGVLAATSLLPAAYGLWPWLAVSALFAFTLFYAVRLNLADDPSCACWGTRPGDTERSLPRRSLAAAALAARNAILVVAATLTTGPAVPDHAQPIAARILAGAVCLAVVGVGLAGSVLHERSHARDFWWLEYSARWRHVSRCHRLEEPVH